MKSWAEPGNEAIYRHLSGNTVYLCNGNKASSTTIANTEGGAKIVKHGEGTYAHWGRYRTTVCVDPPRCHKQPVV